MEGDVMRTRRKQWSGFYVVHDPVLCDLGGPSMARQEFAEECDINTIMAKYETTGTISHFNNGIPQYLDVSQYPEDLMGRLQMVQAAEDAFMRLPAHIRREFDHDPVQFCEFAENPANLDKMREWQLAPPADLPDVPRDPLPPPAVPPAPVPPAPVPAVGGGS